MRYRIKNWTRFQHYRDRNPPWIKLHVEILASADWVMLDDASKLLMIVCMIIGAKDAGVICDDEAYFRRVAYLCKTPNFRPLIECGFLEPLADASNCEHVRATARPEKEKEKEAEKESISRASRFAEFWLVCPRKVGRAKAERLFVKLETSVSADLMIIGMQRYARQQVGKDPTYVLHPATWLNGRRWEDEDGKPADETDGREPTQEEIDSASDRADQYFKRGKYTEVYG